MSKEMREKIDRDIYKDVFREKECFEPIHDYLSNLDKEQLKLVDIGCAAGEFLYSAQKNVSGLQLYGVDPVEDLVESARKNVPGCIIEKGSIENNPFGSVFNIVSCQGVLPIFDELDSKIDSLFDYLDLSEESHIIIFNNSNPYPLDVKMTPARYDDGTVGEQLDGYNVWSNEHIVDALETAADKRNCDIEVKVKPFEMNSEIPYKGDPLRAWTIRLEDGSYMQVRGINTVQRQHFFFARIDKRE